MFHALRRRAKNRGATEMNHSELTAKLKQIGADYSADLARIAASANATPQQFNQAQKLRDAAEQKYVDASIAAQCAVGIKTPVALGRTE
jgi:hypothetical protein